MSLTTPFFEVCGYKVVSERMHRRAAVIEAVVEVRVDQTCVRRSATGVGPIHALDEALRECLMPRFPELERVRLSDYRVSVVDASDGTAAQVKVLVQATDGHTAWDAGCVSANIVDASFEALCSTAVMGIMRVKAA